MGYVNGNLNLTVSANLAGVADKPTQDEILGLLQDADGDKLMLIKNILSSQNDSFVSLVSTINAMQNDLNTVKNNITESGIDIDSAQNIKDALTNAGIAVGDNATLQEIITSLDKSVVNPQDLRSALSALGVSVSASDTIPQLVAKMASIVTLASGSQDANATAAQILSGYSAYAKGSKVNGTIPSLGAQTITPGTTAKAIAAGQYLSGQQTIAGDANLVPANIAKGKSIFGVAGAAEYTPSFHYYDTSTYKRFDETHNLRLVTFNPYTMSCNITLPNGQTAYTSFGTYGNSSTDNNERTMFFVPEENITNVIFLAEMICKHSSSNGYGSFRTPPQFAWDNPNLSKTNTYYYQSGSVQRTATGDNKLAIFFPNNSPNKEYTQISVEKVKAYCY